MIVMCFSFYAVEAIKRVEEIKEKRQGQFIKNRLVSLRMSSQVKYEWNEKMYY